MQDNSTVFLICKIEYILILFKHDEMANYKSVTVKSFVRFRDRRLYISSCICTNERNSRNILCSYDNASSVFYLVIDRDCTL